MKVNKSEINSGLQKPSEKMCDGGPNAAQMEELIYNDEKRLDFK